MKFLHPQFLWALFALAVPLVIHLFNFRRYKTLYFSDTRFLRKVVKQSKNINRLRQLLIMMARMLALAMLVLAFAFPFIPGDRSEQEPPSHASIYIDNSPSMMSGPQQSSPLGEARTRAVEIIKALPQGYRVQILTNDFLGRQQRYYSKAEAIELVDEIRESYAFRGGQDVVKRISSLQEKEKVAKLEAFLISDFQKSSFENLNELPESWQISLLPVQDMLNRGNLSIDSLWFERPVLQPGFDQDLHLRLSHSGKSDNTSANLQLMIEGDLQSARNVQVPPNSSTEVVFGLRSDKPGIYRGELILDAGAPYFDNRFYFSYAVDQPLEILLSGSDAHRQELTKLFSDSIFRLSYQPLNQLDYSRIPDYDLVVIDEPRQMPGGLIQQLSTSLERGKNLVLITPEDDISAVNKALLSLSNSTLNGKGQTQRGAEIHFRDPHFEQVFANEPQRSALPTVSSYYQYQNGRSYPLVSLENGDPLVSRIPEKEGSLILFTADLESSQLLRHPILVPILLNAALYSRSASALYTLAGSNDGPVYPLSEEKEQALKIVIADNYELIPPQRRLRNKVELYDLPTEVKPGIYPVYSADTKRGEIAVNVAGPESDWRFMDSEELARQLGIAQADILEANTADLGFDISRRYRGTSLWKWFIAAALLFLLIEIALIKLWK